ncbi:MAG: asparagine synthase (glutamine-hydrolyzing) [Rhodospirillaceae bacterium]|nr:asparagine synthase (glutamine-hydrolyzing) [Rhodospirillaceae bacterium]
MCGFVVLCQKERLFSSPLLRRLEKDILHRGPDSGGMIAEPGIAMVFRRLAILDPGSTSDQPMTDPTGRYSLVFNGEIYNFRKLRRELEQKGYLFQTEGDTEVLLHGYAHWKKKLFPKVEGMFSLVIFDRHRCEVIAARDTLGIKPLYILKRGHLIGFATEMRSFAGITPFEVDTNALPELLIFRYASGTLSNISDIELLPGGYTCTANINDARTKPEQFDDPLEHLNSDNSLSQDDAVQLSKETVYASVKAHLVSDVGYAVQLSGGVDSSLVTAIAAKETAGTLTSYGVHIPGYPQDERPYRRIIQKRLNLEHHEVTLDNNDFADALPRAIKHMEGPVPHYGCVMLMLLCETIRKKHKVVLTGEGADELFGGYKRYDIWRKLKRNGLFADLVPGFLWPILQRWREIQKFSGRDAAIFGAVYHDILELEELFPPLIHRGGQREDTASRFLDFRERMFAVDQTSYLSSLLMRQDKMAMAASVEARVPFSHAPLAKKINRIPVQLRAPGGDTKPILKRVAKQFLPSEIVDRRKVGLALPLRSWLENETGLGRYLDLLVQPDSQLASYSDPKKVRTAVDDFRNKRNKKPIPLEHLINLELWLRSVADIRNANAPRLDDA